MKSPRLRQALAAPRRPRSRSPLCASVREAGTACRLRCARSGPEPVRRPAGAYGATISPPCACAHAAQSSHQLPERRSAVSSHSSALSPRCARSASCSTRLFLPPGGLTMPAMCPAVRERVLRLAADVLRREIRRAPRRDVIALGAEHVERRRILAEIDRRVVDRERVRLHDRVVAGSTRADIASASPPACASNRCSRRECRTPAAACP